MLPDQDFFVPTPAFRDWVLAQHWLRYRKLIDAGAGRGLMTLVLRELGFDVTAIDLFERPSNLGRVEIADATTYEDYDRNSVLIIARPCHGGWHEQAFLKAARYGCIDMLYIGLEKNIETDFGDEWEIEKLVDGVGGQDEAIWRVYGRKDKLTNYVKTAEGGWGELETKGGEHILRNENGGYCMVDPAKLADARLKEEPYQGSYVDPAIYAKNSERSAKAMHSEPHARDRGQYGWIGPEGRWYPCGSMDHGPMLDRAFGIDRRRSEELGFVKCYGSFYSREYVYRWNDPSDWDDPKRRPTPAQLKTLREVGYDVKDDEQDGAERGLDTLSEVEQAEVAAVMSKPQRRSSKTGYRADRPGD